MWIEELPSGRYRGGFRLPSGKTVRRTFDYAYEAEAWAMEAEQRGQDAASAGAGHQPPAPAPQCSIPTVRAHGDAWLRRRSGLLAAATVTWYRHQLRGIATTDLARAPLTGLKRSDVEGWITSQTRDGVSRTTINARLKVLRMILRDGLAEGLCDRDPTDGIRYLATDIRAERVLEALEEARLLSTADPALAAMCLLALDAGLRWEEAAAVGADCFLGDYVVVRQVVERDTRRIRRYPKGHRARTVPMTPRLKQALAPLIAAARRTGPDTLLFGTADRALDYWNWRRDVYRPACHRARLKPRPRFHDLRHTYGSRLADAGVPRHEIAALMGHADEATTARYIHKGVDGRRLELVTAALVR